MRDRMNTYFQHLSLSSDPLVLDRYPEANVGIRWMEPQSISQQELANSDRTILLELENRLAKLEKLLDMEHALLTSPPISEQLDMLETQIGYLDSGRVEFALSKLKELQQQLDQNKYQPIPDISLEMAEKIDRLYGQVPLIDHALRSLPQVVDRLNSLKRIFYEVSSFSSTLKSMASDQESIKETLNLQQYHLTKVT